MKANTSLIGSLGAELWLTQVLDLLEGKESVDTQISPYHVITIDPCFAVEHAPIVPRATWIGANAKLMPQCGVEHWLSTFLDILEGDILGSSKFGPDVPYGYAPAGYQPPRKHSFPPGGKPYNKKKTRKRKKHGQS